MTSGHPSGTTVPLDLLSSNSALYAALDHLPTVVFVTDTQGRVLFINRRLEEITGLPAAQLMAEGWTRIIHPDDIPRLREDWRAASLAGTIFEARFRYRRPGGDYLWVLSRSIPIRDADGTIVRWLGTSTDIDPLVRAEEEILERQHALIASEQHYRALAQSVAQIVWTADPSGFIDWYNDRWYEYTGQTPEEAAGWGWQAAHHPDDFQKVMEAWPHSIATGERFEMEFRLRGADGGFRWFLTRAEPLYDQSGRIVRWYGTNTDIDQSRRAYERSRHVAQTLQDAFLPSSLPRRPGLRFDAAFVPSESDALIGGDWYDAFELPDGRLAVTLGDVAGHGLQASATAARIRQTLVAASLDSSAPAELLEKANRVLRFQSETIVTALAGIIDPERRRFVYASAGHPPPVLASRSRPARFLEYGGLPLGVTDTLALSETAVPLDDDAVLIFYTDGILEFKRAIEESERTLLAAADRLARAARVARPARFVFRSVLGEDQARDDIAVLVFQLGDEFGEGDLETPPLRRTWRFHSSDPATARQSRHELLNYLRRLAPEADLFVPELIVGELLVNTVEHAPGLVRVSVDWTDTHPVVTVRDSGPGMGDIPDSLPADPFDESGRGLYLVKSLASEVRVHRVEGGSEISVTLPLDRQAEDGLEESR